MNKVAIIIVSLILATALVLSGCVTILPGTETPPEAESPPAPAEEAPAPPAPPPVEPTTPSTTPTTPPPSPLRVHFIDVGQGDSILVDLGETEILIDGGDKWPGVVTYLQEYVDGAIEAVVATHPHADHIGGLIAVAAHFDVDSFWLNGDTSTSQTYSEFMSSINAEGAEIHVAKRGDQIEVGNLFLDVLNPPQPLLGSTNNKSIVLLLSYGDTDFLFTGDAEAEAEASMVSAYLIPDVEVLKVGHHGSKTASSRQFIEAARPEVAIYMAGEGNSYGHPHEETIATLDDFGAVIYGTDIHGTIIVETNGTTYNVQVVPAGTGDIARELTISVDGQGTTNPGPGTYTYDEGTQVTITATPVSGWRFDHWGGDASGSSPTFGIIIDSNKSVTAYFKQVTTIGSNVQITKIFYDGLVYRVESDEYVEITNLGSESQDLAGWVLKDISEGYPSFTFPHYVLAPGGAIRAYTNEIHPEWGGFSFGYGKAIWNNTVPDTAALYNAQGQEISRKSY